VRRALVVAPLDLELAEVRARDGAELLGGAAQVRLNTHRAVRVLTPRTCRC
jgi:hypothetical protein